MANFKRVTGAEVFTIEAHSFAVAASGQGYTLNYSADGVTFTAWDEATPANEVLIVTNIPRSASWKLVGNTDEVVVAY